MCIVIESGFRSGRGRAQKAASARPIRKVLSRNRGTQYVTAVLRPRVLKYRGAGVRLLALAERDADYGRQTAAISTAERLAISLAMVP